MTTPTIIVSPTVTTTYTVTAPSACGMAVANEVIIVNPLPNVDMSANIYEGCTPMCVQFYNTTSIASGRVSQFLWAFGNGDTTYSASPSYCYPNSGKYDVTLTATSDSGCSFTRRKIDMITAYTRPNAAFTYSPQSTTIMEPTIQFTDNSSDIYGLIAWTWNFGDATDSTSKMQNPMHTYQDTGNFCPSLIVMNQHGCKDTATNCLVIDPIFALYIPSAFSPNGDGKNEVFMAKVNDIKSFEMYIFDRWGMQLFHSNSINDGWNGKVGGNFVQEDTYVYMITVYDNKNHKHSYTGNVNVIK
jgi:gliding motility-associated-like protein